MAASLDTALVLRTSAITAMIGRKTTGERLWVYRMVKRVPGAAA